MLLAAVDLNFLSYAMPDKSSLCGYNSGNRYAIPPDQIDTGR